MMLFIIAIHVIICVGLIGLVLVQRGRGGGLVESFSGVESMFGTKTSTFLTRTTTILSIFFFITCLSLAVLSIKQSRSLMRDIKPQPIANETVPAQAQSQATEPVKEATTAATQATNAKPATEPAAAGAQAPFTQPMPEQATMKEQAVPAQK